MRALEDCHLLSVDAVELDRLLSRRQALQDVLLQLTMDGEETGGWNVCSKIPCSPGSSAEHTQHAAPARVGRGTGRADAIA